MTKAQTEASLRQLWSETGLDAALTCIFHGNITQVTTFKTSWIELATKGQTDPVPRSDDRVMMWSAAESVTHGEKACLSEKKWAKVKILIN